MNFDNLEQLIKTYSAELMELGKDQKTQEITNLEETADNTVLQEKEKTISQEDAPSVSEQEIKEVISKEEEMRQESISREEEAATEEEKKEEAEYGSSALFFARVFAGEEIYPVKNAKVKIYNGDKLIAFLFTDEEGTTKKITLPAFPEENSLDKDSTNQTAFFLADVSAAGFIPQKGLEVNTVGGSEVILEVFMTPESEGIS